jgi:hypothetical protein
MVDVDQAELVGRQCLGDTRVSNLSDGIEEPAVEDNGGSVASVVLEVDPPSIQRVSRVWHSP